MADVAAGPIPATDDLDAMLTPEGELSDSAIDALADSRALAHCP